MTIQAIASKYGVTTQAVSLSLRNLLRISTRGKNQGVNKIIYPNIRNWFIKSGESFSNVERRTYFKERQLGNKITKESSYTIAEISSLLKVMNMTFEKAFVQEEENV